MRTTLIIGVLLVIMGVIALAYQSFSYTTQEKAIEIGPLQVTRERSPTIPIAPVVGITLLICGGGLALMSLRKNP